MDPTLTLPPVPLYVWRLSAAVLCALILLVLTIHPVGAEASGDQHHMFNPSVQIDQSQIEVRVKDQAHGTR